MRLLVLSLLTLVPTAASADAIDGPPACPPGALGRSSHSGTWCAAATCAADTDCEGGARCVERRMCAIQVMVTPGGRRASPEPPAPVAVDMVVASCLPSETCTGTGEPWPDTAGHVGAVPVCTTQRVCVAPPLPSLGELLGVSPPEPPMATTPPVSPPVSPPAPPAETSSGMCAAHHGTGPLAPVLGLVCAALMLARRRS